MFNKKNYRFKTIILSFLILFFFSWDVAFAQPEKIIDQSWPESSIVQEQLKSDQEHLDNIQKSISQYRENYRNDLEKLIKEGVTREDLANASIHLTTALAAVDNLRIALADAQESYYQTQTQLNNLRQRYSETTLSAQQLQTERAKALSLDIAQLQQLLLMKQQRVTILQKSFNLAQTQVKEAQSWQDQLNGLAKNQEQLRKTQQLSESIIVLQKKQQQLLSRLEDINKKLGTLTQTQTSRQEQVALQLQVFLIREQLTITHLQLFLTRIQKRIQPLVIVNLQTIATNQIQDKISQAEQIDQELKQIIQAIHNKMDLIKSRKQVLIQQQPFTPTIDIEKAHYPTLENILKQYDQVLLKVNLLRKDLNQYQIALQKALQQQVALRQTLPGFNSASWKATGIGTLEIFRYGWRSLHAVIVQIRDNLSTQPAWFMYVIIFSVVFLISIYFVLRHWLDHLVKILEVKRDRFSTNVLMIILMLLKKNLGAFFLLFSLLAMGALFQIDLHIWIFIVVVYLIYHTIFLLMKSLLFENEANEQGKDVSLYRGLRWILGIGSIMSVITYLAHEFPVAYQVRVLFNKITMLLLLMLSLLLFRTWSVLPILITKVFSVRRTYIKRVIKLICWVLPITIFSNAVIGLVGYVDLAWTIGKYQAEALFILAIYMVVRGILIDFMNQIYDLVIRRVRSGWLWAQALVRPLDRIMRIALFIFTLYVLIRTVGLEKILLLRTIGRKIMTVPLLTLGGNVITVPFLVGVLIFFMLLYWLAKWSREFSFRWLYAKARDIGVRNSLSVFTQYLTVIIGVIIGLRVFGVDLRGFAVVAAVFAGAVGFGLRDVFSNLASGILLLVERPFRAGDIVTIGEYEGDVVGTGMRSMRIRTWDRTEVIIPNANMFTQPFVNWTHQDYIVRTVIGIKIHRHDDPHRVQQLIYDVLKNLPSVIEDPHPEVFLKEMNEALIEFEVRYYINIAIVQSRAKVRSEVLFAIWDCFKQNDIKSPYPQYDIHLHSKQPQLPVKIEL